MKIVDVALAESNLLPPINALFYEYLVTRAGLYVRAEDSRLEACIPVAYAECHSAFPVEPYARLKLPRISDRFLISILQSARRHLPAEAMYQFDYNGAGWTCSMPDTELANPVALRFNDNDHAVVDLHSHGVLEPFFSETDDRDEQGLRFYVVIGKVGTEQPEILCRVGVYGHTWEVSATTIFDGVGPFSDVYERERAIDAAAGQEDFFEAVRNDPDMTAEQKAYWLALEPEEAKDEAKEETNADDP